jgi:hypothetical protein
MGDEPGAPPPPPVAPPQVEQTVDEKPLQKPRKPAASRSQGLPTTEAGEKVAARLQRKLNEMVDAAALAEANRRRATAIDATDCEAGFDRIVGPKKQEAAIVIVADIASAIGSGLIGYAINIYTGSGQDLLPGHLAMLGGAALVVFSIVLKYVTPRM